MATLMKKQSDVLQTPVHLPALGLAKSSRLAHWVGRCLMVLLVVGLWFVIVAPWQQTVAGKGTVIAFAPLDRQQTVEAPIKGRIIAWGEGLRENSHVKKGQMIAEIQDVDANYLSRLKDQLKQSNEKVTAALNELKATEKQRASAEEVVSSYERQVDLMMAARDLMVEAADEFVKAAMSKYESELQKVVEVEAILAQDEADFNRQNTLFEQKIVSEQKLQQADQKYRSAKAKVESAKKNAEAAASEIKGKEKERDAKREEAQSKVDQVRAYEDKARQDISKVDGDIEKARKGYLEAENDLTDKKIKVAQQETQVVVAPRDGFILRLLANEGSEMVKEGEPLCIIVPDTADRAVQLWVKGVDAPLITAGSHVRLQFEGWPAVQFAGWPSVAVGTFGANVVSVDSTDNGKGEFRVVVLPDKDEAAWPNEKYLRQGVRANGFILLEQVPLWYELWRKMNGFPPTVAMPESEGNSEGKSKK